RRSGTSLRLGLTPIGSSRAAPARTRNGLHRKRPLSLESPAGRADGKELRRLRVACPGHVALPCRTIAPCGATSAHARESDKRSDCWIVQPRGVDSPRKVLGGTRRIAWLSSVYDRRAEP